MLGFYLGAALLVGAAFVLGGWIAHVHAERSEAERWHALRLRIRAGRDLLVDATMGQVIATQELACALPRDARSGVPLALELDLAPQVGRAEVRARRAIAPELEAELEHLAELVYLLEALEVGRAIPCPLCGPGTICGRCRSRDEAWKRKAESFDRLASYACTRRFPERRT